ncbi:MAG: response regulator [Nitrospirota bacterium]|nr:response regulator [Nitrospirota bacterium]
MKDKGLRKSIVNILVVEDDRNFGTILRRELEEDKYAVDVVSDGVEAVLSFIDKNYDFVLLDIKIPKLDGINTLKIIKKLNPEVPAITFSGNVGSIEMADSIRVGAEKCLIKPFEIRKLRDDIKKYGSNP